MNIEGGFLTKLAETVIEGSKDGYPELEEKKDFIMNVIRKEEEQFDRTIDQGLVILNEMKEKMVAEGAAEADIRLRVEELSRPEANQKHH